MDHRPARGSTVLHERCVGRVECRSGAAGPSQHKKQTLALSSPSTLEMSTFDFRAWVLHPRQPAQWGLLPVFTG